MNRLRGILLTMILVQAALTAVVTETLLFPLLAVIAAFFAFFRPVPYAWSTRQQVYGLLVLTILMGLKMRLLPLEFQSRFSPFPNNYALNHVFSQGLIMIQIMILATYRFERGTTSAFFSWYYLAPLLGAVQIAAITGFVSRSPLYRQASLGSAACFTVLFALYGLAGTTSPGRLTASRVRILLSLGILGTSLVAGGILAVAAAPGVLRLDTLFFQVFRPPVTATRLGVPDRSTLNSVSATRDFRSQEVILRIQATQAPEYLRVSVSDKFDGRTWDATAPLSVRRPDAPLSTASTPSVGAQHFTLRPHGEAASHTVTIWPAAPSGLLSTTLTTTAIGVSLDRLRVDDHLTVKTDGAALTHPYRLLHGATTFAVRPDADMRRRCLQLPDTLSAEAIDVCRAVLEDASTPTEKMQAVINFFRGNFTYQLGISVPPGQDALSYFLTERAPAHCEFFAAAATVMLRLGGVPCRYVVGYLVTEKNTVGDYWVARNGDAHAWVEAWDDEQGWVIVEATPPSGLPVSAAAGRLARLWDNIKFRWGLLREALRARGLGLTREGLAEAGRWLLYSRTGQGVALLAFFLALLHVYRHHPAGRRKHASPAERRFLTLLRRMDHLVRKKGFQRHPCETLHQFAHVIRTADASDAWHEDAAAWYEMCAALRFTGTSTETASATLEPLLAALEKGARQRSERSG